MKPGAGGRTSGALQRFKNTPCSKLSKENIHRPPAAFFAEIYCIHLGNMVLSTKYAIKRRPGQMYLTTGEERESYDAHLRMCEL